MALSPHHYLFYHTILTLQTFRDVCGCYDLIPQADWLAEAHILLAHNLIQLLVIFFDDTVGPVYALGDAGDADPAPLLRAKLLVHLRVLNLFDYEEEVRWHLTGGEVMDTRNSPFLLKKMIKSTERLRAAVDGLRREVVRNKESWAAELVQNIQSLTVGAIINVSNLFSLIKMEQGREIGECELDSKLVSTTISHLVHFAKHREGLIRLLDHFLRAAAEAAATEAEAEARCHQPPPTTRWGPPPNGTTQPPFAVGTQTPPAPASKRPPKAKATHTRKRKLVADNAPPPSEAGKRRRRA